MQYGDPVIVGFGQAYFRRLRAGHEQCLQSKSLPEAAGQDHTIRPEVLPEIENRQIRMKLGTYKLEIRLLLRLKDLMAVFFQHVAHILRDNRFVFNQ